MNITEVIRKSQFTMSLVLIKTTITLIKLIINIKNNTIKWETLIKKLTNIDTIKVSIII